MVPAVDERGGRLLGLVPVRRPSRSGPRTTTSPTSPAGARRAVGRRTSTSTPTAGWPHERACGASSSAPRRRAATSRSARSRSRRRCAAARAAGTPRGRGAASRWRSARRRGSPSSSDETSRGRASCSSVIAASMRRHDERRGDAARARPGRARRRGRTRAASTWRPAFQIVDSTAIEPAAWNSGATTSQHVSGGTASHLHVHRVGDEVAVGEHHALRRPRRAAGVEEPGEVLLADVVGEVGRRGAGEQLLVPLAHVDRRARRTSARSPTGRPANSTLAPGVLQRVAQLGVGVALVERDDDQPRAGDRLVQLEVAVAVRAHDRDAVALREAEPAAARRRAAGSGPTSPRRSGHVPARDGGTARRHLHGAPQRREHRGHVADLRRRRDASGERAADGT